MPSLFQPRFMGLSVRNFQTSLGWGGQVSQMAVQLVRDAAAGDYPAPPPLGWPAYFQFYGLKFAGLLQRWQQVKSVDGFSYEAVLVDPREVLDGAQLVTGDYNGSVGGVPNLVNCFGWWEGTAGFGSADSNATGMPWWRVRQAVLAICNAPAAGDYGGPLNFKGVAYALDLSELPATPDAYRVAAPVVTLLEAVQQVCDDAAHDFFVELVGLTIRVRTVDRNAQPAMGTISAMVDAASSSGGSPRGEFGAEVRNEVTSSVLVGGPVTALHLTDSIASFWGYDLAGNPIVGTPYDHPDLGTVEQMTLNAAGVADVVGGTSYWTNTAELRCVLHGPAAWQMYVSKYRQADVAPLTYSLLGNDVVDQQVAADAVDDRPAAVLAANNELVVTRTARLYNWLRTMAEGYYGKQFLVRVPFVLAKTDPDTLQSTLSAEPCEAGYLPQGAAGLGLSPLNEQVILAPDERILPFAYFPNLVEADTSRVNWSAAAAENGELWAQAALSQRVVFLPGDPPVPCVVVNLGSALYDRALDVYGGMSLPILQPQLADGGNADALANMDRRAAFGTVGAVGMHPAARYPTLVGVPLKSNTEVYGPWYVAGAPGKVRFESDPGLTPWDYGGWDAMEAAATARVASAVCDVQAQEAGAVTLVGAPRYSLGDVVSTGGPNLTNLDVQFGTQGVTTTYRFQTFTPRFGVFSRQNAERLKRSAVAAVELRRNVRKALNRAVSASQTVAEAFKGAVANVPLYAKKQSPHTVVMAEALPADGLGRVRVGVASETYEAALNLSRPADDDAGNRAVMGWSGLFRPFTTREAKQPGTGFPTTPGTTLPGYWPVATGAMTGPNQTAITRPALDPFASGHDVDVVTNGDEYAGMNAFRRGSDAASTRAVALRGPLVVAGWSPRQLGGGYLSDVGRPSDQYFVGPVDLLWDGYRGVWSSRDVLSGTAPAGIAAAPLSGPVYVGGNAAWQVLAYNPSWDPVPAGADVIVAWCLNESKWKVVWVGKTDETVVLDGDAPLRVVTDVSVACSGNQIVTTKTYRQMTVKGGWGTKVEVK